MKKILRKLHLYLALALFLPLVIQGLSGSLLVFEKAITHFSLYRNHEFATGENASLEEVYTAANKAAPAGFSITLIRLPVEEKNPTIIRLLKSGEKKTFLEMAMDPVSLEVISLRNPEDSTLYVIKKLHTNLLIKDKFGRNLVGALGVVLLFMSLSGLVIWWPKIRDLKRSLTFELISTKTSNKGKASYHRRMHGAIGFWTMGLLFITSFSGIYLAFPQEMASGITTVFNGRILRTEMDRLKTSGQENKATVAEIIKIAQPETNDLQLNSFLLPTKPNQPYRLNFSQKSHPDFGLLTSIFIDQSAPKIIEKFDPHYYSFGEKITALQPLLHEGKNLGIVWKSIVFVIGFLPLLFAITGVRMWWLKSKKA